MSGPCGRPCDRDKGHFDGESFSFAVICMGLLSIVWAAASIENPKAERAKACKAAIEAKADTPVLLAVCK